MKQQADLHRYALCCQGAFNSKRLGAVRECQKHPRLGVIHSGTDTGEVRNEQAVIQLRLARSRQQPFFIALFSGNFCGKSSTFLRDSLR